LVEVTSISSAYSSRRSPLDRLRSGAARAALAKGSELYEFKLDEVVPDGHLVREIAAVICGGCMPIARTAI
jgi:hypothetical protein